MVISKTGYPVGGFFKGSEKFSRKFKGHETFPEIFKGSEIFLWKLFERRIAKIRAMEI